MDIASTHTNPFKVLTPESMDAHTVHTLFVNPFSDYDRIKEPGHTVVSGPRGCGKSMMFRYLLPDCQILALKVPLTDLPFLAFLVSIKNTAPNVTEFLHLKHKHANIVLNEHVLTVFIIAKVFHAISNFDFPPSGDICSQSRDYVRHLFLPTDHVCGGNFSRNINEDRCPTEIFRGLKRYCDRQYDTVVQYARRLLFEPNSSVPPYTGPLYGFTDFLFPLLEGLKSINYFPSVPFYLLIDDADYLSTVQTQVLNSWVSARTEATISLKISTQYRYKTYATLSTLPIQSPHDYQAIDISDVYTTKQSRYLNRVREIVSRRLNVAGISVSPNEFFPCNQLQESKVEEIANRLKLEWSSKGRGYRPSDDSRRYARPEFIRSLGGSSKSRNSYSYSGFEHLVHISSGVVRHFLEMAATMFDKQTSIKPDHPVKAIQPGIQNEVSRDSADSLMLSDFDRFREQEMTGLLHGGEIPQEVLDTREQQLNHLRNLLLALGGIFFLKLVSDDAERRVFSIAISGNFPSELRGIFELGVRYGYFHRSTIGNKDGTGRTPLYVLTRRLAPYFNLDPTGFSGYLWVTSEVLQKALYNPDRLLRRFKGKRIQQMLDPNQLNLFSGEA